MHKLHLALALILTLLLAPVLRAQEPPADARAHRALVISIDGLRPDLLLRADTPNLHALFKRGSFSFWARTTEVSITLPSHVSMMTGVTPDRHGITFNNDGPEEQVYPNAKTLFEVAHQAGYSTALISGKSKFTAMTRPGTVDYVSIPPRGKGAHDDAVAKAAIEIINAHQPQVMLVHFPDNDGIGHSKGWGTDVQIQTIEKADAFVGQVLAALQERNLLDETFIIVSADHGGTGKWHGANDARARHIPWIAAGPGVRQNFDLTTVRELTINTEDTFATTCWMLGIPLPEGIDGRPVQLILQEEAAPAATTR